jgi:hypothetical protein
LKPATEIPFKTIPDPKPEPAHEPFRRIPITNLYASDLPQPEFWIDQLIPAGEVTLLGAHGGMGKTTLALLIAICVCAGKPVLGKGVKQGRVLLFSAEDPAKVVLWRLHQICRHLGLDPASLEGWLLILDATEHDPVLYAEISDGGIRTGITTAAYAALKAAADQFSADLIIIDNASDSYDADENNRPRVRAFIRALAQLVRDRQGAVTLLAHVDKTTARGISAGQGYSGSTAWHNSVRSRLFLSEQDGRPVLEHQKSNLGRKSEPIDLEWADGGVLTLASNACAGLIGSADRNAILGLIDEFYRRGEYISTSPNAPGNAFKTLQTERGFPARLNRSEFFRVLRDAERSGELIRERYLNENRKERERWKVR